MKHATSIKLLFTAMVVAGLFLAAITPGAVYAEGDIPEAPPPEPVETGTIQPEGSITDVVELLAENGAVIVDGQGLGVPLASQAVLDAVCEPDPWFYCSVGCTGGFASYSTLAAAIADWNTRKGYGYLYVEGGLWESIYIDLIGSTMKGIVRDVKNWGAVQPTINGTLKVSGTATGFVVQGINFLSPAGGFTIDITSTGGRVKLSDVYVRSENGAGIFISNHGPVDLLRVNSYNNRNDGAKVISTLGAVTVTNSTFNGNSDPVLGDRYGLYIESAGAVTINGISASFNTGDGLYVAHTGPLTIRNGVFTNTLAGLGGSGNYGYGIRTWSTGPLGNVTIDNVIFSDNENAGAMLSTVANITIKRVNAYDNSGAGVIIIKTPGELVPGARNVSVLDSNFSKNGGINLSVSASGSITVTNIYSGLAGTFGLFLDNTYSATRAPVTLSRAVVGNSQTNAGITVASSGNVTLNGVTSSYNPLGHGVRIETSGSIFILSTLGKNTFDQNGYAGLKVTAGGSVVLSNVQANSNAAPLVMHAGIFIYGTGLSSNVTLTNITASGNGSAGVYIDTTGSVTWTKGVVNKNGTAIANYGGVYINTWRGILKPIRLAGVAASSQVRGDGLYLTSSGPTTLTNIVASGNELGCGMEVISDGAVSLLGIYNQFNNNYDDGVYIHNSAKATLLNVEAQYNRLRGINLEMVGDAAVSASTAGWVNQINHNTSGHGLSIITTGTVNVNKVQANGNGGTGIYINTEPAFAPKTVTLANITASDNLASGSSGVYVRSLGSVAVNSITAINNKIYGAYISNTSDTATPPGVTVTKGTFSLNGDAGLAVYSYGKIALSNLTSVLNTGSGVYANNQGSPILAPIAVSGVNQFSYSKISSGLYLVSSGNVTLAGITASDNAYMGIYLRTTENVTLYNLRIDGNEVSYGVGFEGVVKNVTVNNLFSVHNSTGLYISHLSGSLKVSNSIFAANTNLGLYAFRDLPVMPYVLTNVTFLGNNNGGAQYTITP